MGVIVIYNDINEIVGIAKDYESAVNFLFDNHLLDSEFEVMDEEYKWIPLKDLKISIEDIKQMSINEFNELFDDLFYLDIETVWGM